MSPFEFSPYSLQSIQVAASGYRIPNTLYKLDWKANNMVHPYLDLSNVTEHGISLQKYATHLTFYAFDLQLEQGDGHVEAQKSGTTAISLIFSDPVPAEGLQLIVYAEFDSLLELGASRSVIHSVLV